MKKPLLLSAFTASLLLAHQAVAQTPTGDGNWVVYDKPLPPVTTKGSQGYSETQGGTYVPLDADVYRMMDRYTIKYGPDTLSDPHTSVRPFTRASMARLGQRILQDSAGLASLSASDRFNATYLLHDNWNYAATDSTLPSNRSRRVFLKNYYRNQTDLFHVNDEGFTLRINPVIGVQAGYDSDIDGLRYINTRGLQVEGTIDRRLGFYTFVADNQMAVPYYVQQRIQRDDIVPHEGYWKYYKQVIGAAEAPNKYDFLSARGYLTYAATKHINVQLGHDRNFIGNSYRSLILSDYAAPYFFLKLNTRIWKFNYQNLFADMTGERSGRDTVYMKKFMVLHHLSLDLTPTFNVGVFESVMFGRRSGHLEVQYLNPIIFYRSVEQAIGSADNAILGLDFKWNIRRTAQIYGQVVLDELVVSQVRSGNGWWSNKQAVQLGAKYLDVAGIRNLDVQAEFNYIRPYTYQHADQYRNYQHYAQPLAHPMGANLYELLGVVSYQPLPRLNVVAKGFYTVQGHDTRDSARNVINYGGNVLLPYSPHPMDFGNRVGQGEKINLFHGDLTATWQLRHNLWIDAKQIVRRSTSSSSITNNEAFTSVGLRWNIAQRLHEF
ncbi:capsule assembly Wzi family protein [Hymenobacter sp. BT175]|uniref:capsule assembly Wzi family protein n=1 Tax=Hymenobacter translucens TaxID=2886507 RepID=UPI001D0F32D2|nr:capsule assembly Wzi family protein [Hymenobacter translucens]MCC2546191.1 capsule assembly Wzi family protein [Hymenobacter translucens]